MRERKKSRSLQIMNALGVELMMSHAADQRSGAEMLLHRNMTWTFIIMCCRDSLQQLLLSVLLLCFQSLSPSIVLKPRREVLGVQNMFPKPYIDETQSPKFPAVPICLHQTSKLSHFLCQWSDILRDNGEQKRFQLPPWFTPAPLYQQLLCNPSGFGALGLCVTYSGIIWALWSSASPICKPLSCCHGYFSKQMFKKRQNYQHAFFFSSHRIQLGIEKCAATVLQEMHIFWGFFCSFG